MSKLINEFSTNFELSDQFKMINNLNMENIFPPLQPKAFPGIENIAPAPERKTKSARKRRLIEPIELEINIDAKKARKPFSIVNAVSKAMDAPSLKRSFSLRDKHKLPATNMKLVPYHTPQRSRKSILDRNLLVATNWVETVAEPFSCYTKSEIRIQEAIYTLYRTEIEYLQDLELIVNTLAHPMLNLELVTKEEYATIFSNINELIPVHEHLIVRLQQVKCIDGTFGDIAKPFLEWIPKMSDLYFKYCPNLVFAKELFEMKKQKQTFCDYLQRCRESELSRKIDFWTFLDSPRSRLMKYPIMLKEISRLTQSEDFALDCTIKELEEIITIIDEQTGSAKCDLVKRSFQFLTESQRIPEIDFSNTLHFMGEMRNRHNAKITVFLFDKVLVTARTSIGKNGAIYNVYRQPIPISDLEIENVSDQQIGTFRRRSTMVIYKNQIRFSSKSKLISSISLQCQSDFDKKAWLEALNSAL